jgi:uncharacterized coiled-coil protein SlyX
MVFKIFSLLLVVLVACVYIVKSDELLKYNKAIGVNLTEELEELGIKLSTVSREIKTHTKTIDEINRKLDQQQRRIIDEMNKKFEAMDEKFARMDANFNRITGMLNLLEPFSSKAVEALKLELANYKKDPDNHFMSLLRLAIQLRSHHNVDSEVMTRLKDQLPDKISIMASPHICTGKNGYLLASTSTVSIGQLTDQRLVKIENGTNPTSGYSWQLELSESDDYFYLKNVDLGQYVYTTEKEFPNNSDYLQLNLAPKQDTDTFKWKLYLDKDQDVQFKNVKNSKTLCSACGQSQSKIKAICIATYDCFWTVKKC